MGTCSACGYEITPEDNFCSNCGARYAPAQVQVSSEAAPQAALATAFDGHSARTNSAEPEQPDLGARQSGATQTTQGRQSWPPPGSGYDPYVSPNQPPGQYGAGPFPPSAGGSASHAAPAPPTVGAGQVPVPVGYGAPQAAAVCANCGQAWTGSQACTFCGQVWGLPRGIALSSAGRRLGGYLLDGVLIFCTLVIGWVIWTLIVWAQGQTPGKQILGMRVVRLDTRAHAGWGRMFLRDFVGKLLVSLTFGLLFIGGVIADCWLLWDQDRQELWDKIAGTVVVNDPDKQLAPSA